MRRSLEMRRSKNLDAFDEIDEINWKTQANNDSSMTVEERLDILKEMKQFMDSIDTEESIEEIIDDDDRAAIDAARSESYGTLVGLKESEMPELWSASDLGKYTINIPMPQKKAAEEQDMRMLPVSELEFQEISDEADQEDIEMQKKFEQMAEELEGIF